MSTATARHNMVTQQIRTWDVLEPQILDLFERTPREDFVHPAFKHLAYTDSVLPLPHGNQMLPPREQARALQALNIKPSDRILEIGTGTGYLTSMFARLGHHVVTIDINPDMSEMARQHIEKMKLSNKVTFEVGDGLQVSTDDRRFDVICFNGSIKSLPERFPSHLNVGGRLFAIIGSKPAMLATLITRLNETDWQNTVLFETIAPRLIQNDEKQTFEF